MSLNGDRTTVDKQQRKSCTKTLQKVLYGTMSRPIMGVRQCMKVSARTQGQEISKVLPRHAINLQGSQYIESERSRQNYGPAKYHKASLHAATVRTY